MSIKKSSKVIMDKQSKLAALVARLSLMISRKESPSEYQRYVAARQKYLQLKKSIIRKNSAKAIIVARTIIKNS